MSGDVFAEISTKITTTAPAGSDCRSAVLRDDGGVEIQARVQLYDVGVQME